MGINLKESARELCERVNKNPFLCLHYCIRETKEFSNLKNPILQCLTKMEDHSLDIAWFLLLRHLTESSDPMDEHGNLETNFTVLSSFLADLMKKYYKR